MSKVLIIGNGGREHALAWKVAQSTLISEVIVAPGNPGTAAEPKVRNVAIDPLNIQELLQFAQQHAICLTIVGPEGPLSAGIVDTFLAAGLACFGPTRAAAQLESSKAYSKAFMAEHHIPTARYQIFTDVIAAKDYIDQQPIPIVIKADGLAGGKGVVVANDRATAYQAVEDFLIYQTLGSSGATLVIEEFLEGEEVSFIALVDGEQVVSLATSQDHKARDDGDRGPNTGGMGAYSPAPLIDQPLHQQILDSIVLPTVRALAKQGHPYRGFLYAGLMIDKYRQPKVLEYNCRLGDPEAQVILRRLTSDLVELCQAALTGNLKNTVITWDSRPALGIVMTAGGYPNSYEKDKVINGLDRLFGSEIKIFHAGTRTQNEQYFTSGGRVLCVTALADTFVKAQEQAYEAVKQIHWQDVYYRQDIGYRAVNRENLGLI